MTSGEPSAQHQLLSFVLAGEQFALEVGQIREIIEYDPPTRVPSAPAHVRGVINLRGTVVPVFDLAVRLGVPAAPPGKRTCILVAQLRVRGETTTLGLVVDAILSVLDVADGDLEPAPALGLRVPAELLVGLARQDGKLLHVLDLRRALEVDPPDAPGAFPTSPPAAQAT